MPTPSLYQLIYASTANHAFTPHETRELLAHSRERNAIAGVTGILLYHDESFLQVLEGAKETVDALYARIERDPRHFAVTALWKGMIEHREFPEFAMAFRVGDAMENDLPTGFSDALRARLPYRPNQAISPATRYVNLFRRVTGLDR